MPLKLKLTLVCLSLCFQWGFAARAEAPKTGDNLPGVFCANPHALARAKAACAAGDASLKPALDELFSAAARALDTRPPSVMDKRRIPPSGDKHDYVSQAPYFWRDTNSPDGRYVRRDGEHNPDAGRDSDAGGLSKVCSTAQTLALAWYFSDDEKYAAKAAQFVRVWFLDPATRMNPNLNFGQGIPDEVDGRPAGLIGARGLVDLVDAMELLAGSKSWTAADQQGMQEWMRRYFQWLTTSRIGLGEAAAKNNHGSFYDAQAASVALFIGKRDFARNIILNARAIRIASQIEPDGRQPLELARTKSFGYSVFNLRALLDLASIGQNVGVDLWHYTTADGRGIARALEFMAPYADLNQKWPYKEIQEVKRNDLGQLLLRAAPEYPGTGLAAALKRLPAEVLEASRNRLLFKTAID